MEEVVHLVKNMFIHDLWCEHVPSMDAKTVATNNKSKVTCIECKKAAALELLKKVADDANKPETPEWDMSSTAYSGTIIGYGTTTGSTGAGSITFNAGSRVPIGAVNPSTAAVATTTDTYPESVFRKMLKSTGLTND